MSIGIRRIEPIKIYRGNVSNFNKIYFSIHQIGTRFRPLSLDVPKPLFPIAGRSIIQHHIEACIQIKELREILIIGYYAAAQMEKLVSDMQNMYDVGIRYKICLLEM